jgi:hypothetical protein
MVCVRLPRSNGTRYSKVWEVTATMGAVTELGRQLMAEQIQMVTLEATDVIWGSNEISVRFRRSVRHGRVRDGCGSLLMPRLSVRCRCWAACRSL